MTPASKTPEINLEASDLELANFKIHCDIILSGPHSRESAKEVASFIMLSIGRKKIETTRCGKMPKTAKTRANLDANQETRDAQGKSKVSQISVIGAKIQE